MKNIKSRLLKFTYVKNHVNNCVENHAKNFKVCWKPCQNFKVCWKPCQKFQGMLKTMLKISRCVENHFKNFKACWKPCYKLQSVSKITMTWPLHDHFHQFWNIITVIKIKSDIINEDYRSLCATCQVWLKSCVLLKRKLGLFVGNSCMICMLQKICFSTLWTFLFSFKLNKFVRFFTGIRKLRINF